MQINKGVELMLRREKTEEAHKILSFKKTLSLFKKKIQIMFEFSWGG